MMSSQAAKAAKDRSKKPKQAIIAAISSFQRRYLPACMSGDDSSMSSRAWGWLLGAVKELED